MDLIIINDHTLQIQGAPRRRDAVRLANRYAKLHDKRVTDVYLFCGDTAPQKTYDIYVLPA